MLVECLCFLLSLLKQQQNFWDMEHQQWTWGRLSLWAVEVWAMFIFGKEHRTLEFLWCPSFHCRSQWVEDTRGTSYEQGFYILQMWD
jgi:hypothetical protein